MSVPHREPVTPLRCPADRSAAQDVASLYAYLGRRDGYDVGSYHCVDRCCISTDGGYCGERAGRKCKGETDSYIAAYRSYKTPLQEDAAGKFLVAVGETRGRAV